MAGKRAQNGRNSGGHEGAGRKNRPAPSRLAPYSKPRHAYTYTIYAVGQAINTRAYSLPSELEEEIEEGAIN